MSRRELVKGNSSTEMTLIEILTGEATHCILCTTYVDEYF